MSGIEVMRTEHERQISVEGFTAEHDAELGLLTMAALCYASEAALQLTGGSNIGNTGVPSAWPWEASLWKPSTDPSSNLAKAGALLAAELDLIELSNTPDAEGE